MQAFSRRELLKHGSVAALAPQLSGRWSPAFAAEPDLFPIAETATGKVRGVSFGGIIAFKGIPYGAPTGGKNRFKGPQPVVAWSGVRDGSGFGQISPQPPANPGHQYEQIIEWDKHPGGMGEDCLNLNIWTPGLDGAKRPVFVSFHGGGFSAGSSNGPQYHGDPLARYANAVVVTINHRLGAYGYLHLGDLGGDAFADSGNAGMLDLVASLEWVKDNIANFGGDPSTVMIFGQSGGGRKVSAVLAMPAAKGLFHRAASQSGAINTILTRDEATANAQLLLQELGIGKDKVADLQSVPLYDLLNAEIAVYKKKGSFAFEPVVDGKIFPRQPFEPAAPEWSNDIPLILSSVLDEAALALENFDLDDAGLVNIVNKRYGADGPKILDTFKKTYPNTTPFLLQARIFSQFDQRARVLRQADRKSAAGGAPCWVYRFDFPSPAYGGKFGTVHAIDTSLVFHNNLSDIAASPPPELLRLTDQLAATWVAFAKTGNPNNSLVPQWPAYESTKRTTMLFDRMARAAEDPDRELRVLVDSSAKG